MIRVCPDARLDGAQSRGDLKAQAIPSRWSQCSRLCRRGLSCQPQRVRLRPSFFETHSAAGDSSRDGILEHRPLALIRLSAIIVEHSSHRGDGQRPPLAPSCVGAQANTDEPPQNDTLGHQVDASVCRGRGRNRQGTHWSAPFGNERLGECVSKAAGAAGWRSMVFKSSSLIGRFDPFDIPFTRDSSE